MGRSATSYLAFGVDLGEYDDLPELFQKIVDYDIPGTSIPYSIMTHGWEDAGIGYVLHFKLALFRQYQGDVRVIDNFSSEPNISEIKQFTAFLAEHDIINKYPTWLLFNYYG